MLKYWLYIPLVEISHGALQPLAALFLLGTVIALFLFKEVVLKM